MTRVIILFFTISLFSKHLFSQANDSIAQIVPESYEKIIPKNALTRNGLISFHIVSGKYYFDLPATLLNKDLLMVTRITKSPEGVANVYSGDLANEMIVHFEKGPSDKILLRRDIFEVHLGDTSSEMYRSIARSNISSIIATFPIKAYSHDSSRMILDLANYIIGDNEGFGIHPYLKARLKLDNLESGNSFLTNVLVFPENVEITTFKSYVASTNININGKRSVISETRSFQLNTSIILLPE